MVAHALTPSTWEAEAYLQSSEFKAILVYIVQDQPELHTETLDHPPQKTYAKSIFMYVLSIYKIDQ